MESNGVVEHRRGCGNSTECTKDKWSENCQEAGSGTEAIKVRG